MTVHYDGQVVLDVPMPELRDIWESTSFALEKLQCNPHCVMQEQSGLRTRTGALYNATFNILPTPESIIQSPPGTKYRVAVVRQEGSNGDRELCSAFHAAGMEVWDVAMYDLTAGESWLLRC